MVTASSSLTHTVVAYFIPLTTNDGHLFSDIHHDIFGIYATNPPCLLQLLLLSKWKGLNPLSCPTWGRTTLDYLITLFFLFSFCGV